MKINDDCKIKGTSKLRVFISSKCGGRYSKIRKQIKKDLEATGIAEVYLFEEAEASTISRDYSYLLKLAEADVCFFLIDNKDGVAEGVQKEIDTANKYGIKSFYYFCNSRRKEKTTVQVELESSNSSKYKEVKSFGALGKGKASVLVEDILFVYHIYCRKPDQIKLNEDGKENNLINLNETISEGFVTMPKAYLDKIDKCRDYFDQIIFSLEGFKDELIAFNSDNLDEACTAFLPVVFKGVPISSYNVSLLIELLKERHNAIYSEILEFRWKAIEAYYGNCLQNCINYLELALKIAKEKKLQEWVIEDILIDLRNVDITRANADDTFIINEKYQQEISNCKQELNYPILDRLSDMLGKQYIHDMYDKKTQSPYTIVYGENYDKCVKLIANYYVVSVYYGSLTHILLIGEKIRDFLFYLTVKENSRTYKLNLLKFAICSSDEKKVEGIERSYPDIVNRLSSVEAKLIMEASNAHPVFYKRFGVRLLALKAVGYFLTDDDFIFYKSTITKDIDTWLDNSARPLRCGERLLSTCEAIYERFSQDELAQLCFNFFELHYSTFYKSLFRFMTNCIDISKMSAPVASKLINYISNFFEEEQGRKVIRENPNFLINVRIQNASLTECLDSQIKECLTENDLLIYEYEITKNQEPLLSMMKIHINAIKRNNQRQGRNGCFSKAINNHLRIRQFLVNEGLKLNGEDVNELMEIVNDTVVLSKEGIQIKIDALSLLISIYTKYPKEFEANKIQFNRIYENHKHITGNNVFTKVDEIALKIAVMIYLEIVNKKDFKQVLQDSFARLQNDIPTLLSLSYFLKQCFSYPGAVMVPNNVSDIILQYATQWTYIDNLSLRVNSAYILFSLSRRKKYQKIVESQLIRMINDDSAITKSHILHFLKESSYIGKKTKDYIDNKCQSDENFVIRKMVADADD